MGHEASEMEGQVIAINRGGDVIAREKDSESVKPKKTPVKSKAKKKRRLSVQKDPPPAELDPLGDPDFMGGI